MKLLAVLAVAGQSADLATLWVWVSRHGISGESNPLMRWLWEVSPWLASGATVLMATVVVTCLLELARTWPRGARAGMVSVAAMGLLGAGVNTLSLAVAR